MTKRVPAEQAISGRIDAPDFDLELSMDCGQIFGWDKRGRTYWGIMGSGAVGLRQEDAAITFVASPGVRPDDIVRYLGLEEDLTTILKAITVDDFMQRVVSKVRGLRLFKQAPWPCLCSYIISANNRVERIDSLVKEIARQYGTAYSVGEQVVYGLPEPHVLAACLDSGLRACGVGFRAPYLLDAARLVADGTVDLESIYRMAYEDARDVLKTIAGVGDKIADCVLLFAFSKYESFPVDVWIKRAIQAAYFDSGHVKIDDIRQFGRQHFGKYAGYAQEYIYHYARSQRLI